MNKQIFSIGYDIPGKDDNYIDFHKPLSLMDADILLISPDSLRPWGDWVSFTTSDGGCYNVEASNRYKEKISHLKKEIEDHLRAGKSVFIFLTQEEKENLADGVSTLKKGRNRSQGWLVNRYVNQAKSGFRHLKYEEMAFTKIGKVD